VYYFQGSSKSKKEVEQNESNRLENEPTKYEKMFDRPLEQYVCLILLNDTADRMSAVFCAQKPEQFFMASTPRSFCGVFYIPKN
jgi:hypothetical protein